MDKRILYHNYRVVGPNGNHLFFCNEKRKNYYLRKNLAVVISDNPVTIKLSFDPAGPGAYGPAIARENKCCVCGTDDDLTKHHVIPLAYRKLLPEKDKSANFYDVLPVCEPCHTAYEKIAHQKKLDLAKQYDAPISGVENKKNILLCKIRTFAIYHSRMDEKRKESLRKAIEEEFKTSLSDSDIVAMRIPDEQLRDKINNEYKSHSEIVMSKVEDVHHFVESWRQHFVDTMKPKFLPQDWEVKRDLWGRKY